MRTLAALALGLAAAAQAGPLRAGAHAVDLTPERFPIVVSGNFLAGVAQKPAGVLKARALALEEGGRRVVILVVDTLMMPLEMLDRVKEAASRSTGIPSERMLIAATHTHSAPPLIGALGTDPDPAYIEFVEARLVRAIEGAVKNLEPARAGWGVVDDPEHTHCRRWILRPDRLRKDPFGELTVRANMHPGYQHPDFVGPAGPVDPALTVLAIQSAAGRPLALLANYSMHYVGAGSGVVSPDYYGAFAANMENLIGSQQGARPFVAMMSQGTSGDQHWMDYGRPKKPMDINQYAAAMAEVALGVYKKIAYRSSLPVAIAESRLKLARRVAGAERLAWAREVVARMGTAAPRNQQEVYAREQVLIAAEPERELRLQALRIGNLGIAAIPAEVFGITGLHIKRRSPLQPTLNMELANGAEGYIPPPEQHKLGGYTTWAARTAALEPSAEPRIVEAVLGLLEQVSGKPRRTTADANGPYAKAILGGRPAAYWRAGEFGGPVAADSSGHGNQAAYHGGIAFYMEGPPLAGEPVNRAPHFAGGHLRARSQRLGQRYSVELWFSNALPADARAVAGYLFSAASDRLALKASGKLAVENGGKSCEGTRPVALKTWNHAALVRDTGGLRLYLNGAPEVECSGNGQTASGMLIGARESAAETFEGRIDEIAVFNRALSPKEIARHYAAAGTR